VALFFGLSFSLAAPGLFLARIRAPFFADDASFATNAQLLHDSPSRHRPPTTPDRRRQHRTAIDNREANRTRGGKPVKKGNSDPRPPALQKEIDAVEAKPDRIIDTSEMPHLTDGTTANTAASAIAR